MIGAGLLRELANCNQQRRGSQSLLCRRATAHAEAQSGVRAVVVVKQLVHTFCVNVRLRWRLTCSTPAVKAARHSLAVILPADLSADDQRRLHPACRQALQQWRARSSGPARCWCSTAVPHAAARPPAASGRALPSPAHCAASTQLIRSAHACMRALQGQECFLSTYTRTVQARSGMRTLQQQVQLPKFATTW